MIELTDAERGHFERDEDNRQRRWVESILHKPCGEAARGVAARGSALMLWIDSNGEFRALRINRETSLVREFVPDFINRGRPK
jgi:hypothetical protein